jgi:hypothetical protein
MKITERIIAGTMALIDPRKADALQARIDELEVELRAAAHELKAARYRGDSFFAVIERIGKERDEWREMYKASVSIYHGSLASLETALGSERQNLRRLAAAYNALRVEHALDPVTSWDAVPGPEAPPVGLAREYAEKMIELFGQGHPDFREERKRAGKTEDRPVDCDVIAEREIASTEPRPAP